jgi:hypothetical protein
LKKFKALPAIFVALILAMALARTTGAQTPNDTQTFFSNEYAGISIKLNATRETTPGANMTIDLWTNCTADGVYLDYLNLTVYGYSHFKYGLQETTLNAQCVLQKISLVFNHTEEYVYDVPIPTDVWDLTYAELSLKYTVKSLPLEYEESFPITTVRNVVWEELENQLASLNETYQQLNITYEQLNQTYWALRQNYTSLQGSVNELDNTRTAVGVLAITTVFFVATTLYMAMRRPKESW